MARGDGVKWSGCANCCRSLPLFFFSFDCSTIAMRRRVPTLFEYGHYYENGKHDNHERLPDVRTMSSPAEILASELAQTAIKRFLNDNTVAEHCLSGLSALSSCYVIIIRSFGNCRETPHCSFQTASRETKNVSYV